MKDWMIEEQETICERYAGGNLERKEAFQEAFDSMCNQGELSPGEGRIESYNAGISPHQQKTRYAVTVE
jgi:hypothetical protein